jgi:16S rRNA (uracil1498-N3)-methyltransferase
MQLFYTSSVSGNLLLLDEKESKHCVRVLRMKRGDKVTATDGRGNIFEGIISNPDQQRCEITVTGVHSDPGIRNYRIHIAISPLKNPERFEWFTEKCVEIGIDEITPVICRNTEKHTIKYNRVNSIILSAMKQSVKTIKTELNATCSFGDFIRKETTGKRMIAHCSTAGKRESLNDTYARGENVTIMIGPEGDFSHEEITYAVTHGFIPVHLGTSRLRSETAGIVACHSIYILNL